MLKFNLPNPFFCIALGNGIGESKYEINSGIKMGCWTYARYPSSNQWKSAVQFLFSNLFPLSPSPA